MQKVACNFLGINSVKSADIKFDIQGDNNNFTVLQKLKENPVWKVPIYLVKLIINN